MAKNQFQVRFWSVWPKFGSTCFFKKLASSFTRYYGQVSLCMKSDKSKDSVLRKFSQERTDRQVDRNTDESDFRLTSSVQHAEVNDIYAHCFFPRCRKKLGCRQVKAEVRKNLLSQALIKVNFSFTHTFCASRQIPFEFYLLY